MQISEHLQFEQMFAIAVPKDECYQGAPRVQEQASKETEPYTVLVLHHSYVVPEGATRFGIHMVQILRKE
jgi:hypothetical protein